MTPWVRIAFPTLGKGLAGQAVAALAGAALLLLGGCVPTPTATPTVSVPGTPTGSAAPTASATPGLRNCDTQPWLMFVDSDGVRVYRRT